MAAPPPPNYLQSTPPPPGGGYYPPPPSNGERPNYQQPSHSYPAPSSSPPYSQHQTYPPPPSQPPQANQSNYPPPPPLQQQFSDNNSHNASYQPPLQSPPIQGHHIYPPDKNFHPYIQPPQTEGYGGEQTFGDVEKPLETDQSSQLASSAPSALHRTDFDPEPDASGTFNGGAYRISNRDCNTMLTIELAPLIQIFAKPGAMIGMSPTITLKAKVGFKLARFITGGEIVSSEYTGPGQVLLAPPFLGDITPIKLFSVNKQEEEKVQWNVGKDAFIACTAKVVKEVVRQSISKAIFSGEALWVYAIKGNGVLWISSFGAIVKKDLGPGEKFIIDNGHLVAWSCDYVMERVASGGYISSMFTGEGLVCKFQGPGTVYFQTRNPTTFAAYLGGHVAAK